MSSPDRVQPWRPEDFDPVAAAAALLAPAMGAPRGVPARPAARHPRIGEAATVSAGWAPPALEVYRPEPKRPARGDRELGYDEGFAAGVEAGREAGEAHVAPALMALDGLMQRLEGTAEEFARERERNLVALAFVVARKLVQQELEARPEVLQGLVDKALELIPAGSASEVRMHPDDLESLVPAIEKLALEGRVPAVQWVGDPSLSRGSFMIDSPVRVIDGRVDTALRQLFERIEQ